MLWGDEKGWKLERERDDDCTAVNALDATESYPFTCFFVCHMNLTSGKRGGKGKRGRGGGKEE